MTDANMRRTRPDVVSRRALAGARLLVLAFVLLLAVGATGRAAGNVLITTTLGPTAYVLLAHPDSEAARVRSSVMGHLAATACGLFALAIFGLWHHPSVPAQHYDTWPQIFAQALSVGLTLFVVTILRAQHPPAAATALLITSGIARPGPPLYGMLTGLALVILAGAFLSRVPGSARGH